MKRIIFAGAVALAVGVVAGAVLARQTQVPQPFFVGNRLGLPVTPAPDGAFEAISSNVKVYGSIYSAESCSYDAARGLIVVPNRGVPQNVQTNNAWVSLLNHDGSVHTARWIGVQGPAERGSLTPPLVLNEPYGSDIANGMLYLADRDGGTTPTEPSVAVIRRFNLQTGAPAGEIRVERSAWFNDIEVANDGTIYATQTGDRSEKPDPTTWQVWKISAERRGLAPPGRRARRAHRPQHPERGVDVLRRRGEPVGDPDESQQRAGVRAAGAMIPRSTPRRDLSIRNTEVTEQHGGHGHKRSRPEASVCSVLSMCSVL